VATLVFVAGRRHELSAVRQDVAAYGGSAGRQWRPFLPQDVQVGPLVQELVAREGFYSKVVDIDAQLVETIRRAAAANEIVLIVIDPWTVRIQSYRDPLRAYDRQTFINCALLVPGTQAMPRPRPPPTTFGAASSSRSSAPIC
jgi:FxsC-like protein